MQGDSFYIRRKILTSRIKYRKNRLERTFNNELVDRSENWTPQSMFFHHRRSIDQKTRSSTRQKKMRLMPDIRINPHS